jgi:hypothetical protein
MSTDSYDKIRLKAGPKQYKSHARLSKRARLQQRVHRLTLDLRRFAIKATNADDATWATNYADDLTK